MTTEINQSLDLLDIPRIHNINQVGQTVLLVIDKIKATDGKLKKKALKKLVKQLMGL